MAAYYGWNLLGSDDEWTAPVQAEVGPDGHVWIGQQARTGPDQGA